MAVRRVNLAVILRALGLHQEALREIEEALRIFRQKLPEGHPEIQSESSASFCPSLPAPPHRLYSSSTVQEGASVFNS